MSTPREPRDRARSAQFADGRESDLTCQDGSARFANDRVGRNRNGCTVYAYADDGAILADQSNYATNLVNNDVARQTNGCFH